MFHKVADMEFPDGTAIEVVFRDGKVKHYDVALLFGKYPQMRALEDRNLFLVYGVRCISGEEWKCVDIFLHENYNYHIKYIRVHVITIGFSRKVDCFHQVS